MYIQYIFLKVGLLASYWVILWFVYSVKQSDRITSKTDIFHKPTTY